MNDPVEIREERMVSGDGSGSAVPGSAQAGTGTYSSRSGVYPVGYRATQIIWLVVGLVNVILAFDFFFRILRATDAGFASLIYALGALAAPFDPIFGLATFRGANGVGVVRWSDPLAMLVYSLLALGATKVVRIFNMPKDSRT